VAVADQGLMIGGMMIGGMEGIWGRYTLLKGVRRFGEPPSSFSLEMLLETHFEVSNYTTFTQIGHTFGTTMAKKCGEE
jgi:hypothetical protein